MCSSLFLNASLLLVGLADVAWQDDVWFNELVNLQPINSTTNKKSVDCEELCF